MDGIAAGAPRLEELRETRDPRFAAEVQRCYEPYRELSGRLRAGDAAAAELALAFLEADPWCFRSGCMKADLMHALANGPSLQPVRARVQAVVTSRDADVP